MSEQASILLIEDEANLRHNLQVLLAGEGYRVVSVEDGADGIHTLQHESFDLVITDVVMPQVDGFQVMEYVKDYYPDIIVVAITAFVSTESAIEALRRGAYDYLAKPFDVDLLLFVIKRALEKCRMQKAFRHYLGGLEQQVEEQTRQLAQAQAQVEQSMEELRSAQEQLLRTERFRVLGEVTAAATHKLGDSLATIMGFAQFLAKTSPPSSGVQAPLEQIGELAFRCHEIVKHLRAFSWTPTQERIQANLNDICEQMLIDLGLQTDLSHVDIVRRFDPHLPPTIVAPEQLLQACTSIALHACQRVIEPGQRARLIVETAQAQRLIRVIVSVKASSPKGAAVGSFEPYANAEQTLSELGLSLAYGTIREHGGRASVHTTLGEGMTYVVELPIRSTLASPIELPLEPSEVVRRKRVLIIDADNKTQALLQEIVHHLGHDTAGCSSLEQALQTVALDAYDLLIIDTFLPPLDTADFYRQLKALRPELAQRLLFISDGIISDQMRVFLEQIDGYLIKKPFSVADIEAGMQHAGG